MKLWSSFPFGPPIYVKGRQHLPKHVRYAKWGAMENMLRGGGWGETLGTWGRMGTHWELKGNIVGTHWEPGKHTHPTYPQNTRWEHLGKHMGIKIIQFCAIAKVLSETRLINQMLQRFFQKKKNFLYILGHLLELLIGNLAIFKLSIQPFPLLEVEIIFSRLRL